MPFFWLFAAIFVNYMLIAVNDNRLSMGTLVGRSFFRYLTTFFFLIIGYLSIQRNSDVTKYIKLFYALSIIVFVYTMIGLVLHNDLVTMLGGGELDLTIDDRTKVPSITGFMYNGFIGSMLSIVAFYNPYKLLTNKRRWILFIMGTVMIIAAGFRVNIIAFVGGMVLAFVLGRSKKAIKPLALAGVLSIALYMVLPSFSDLVNSTLSLSSGESDVGGSSGNMRIQQWAIAYSYLLDKPLWGHGFSYFSENIMAFYGRDGQSGDLMGGEGYYILMFIEEGGIQVILSTIFFVFFIIYFMKKKQYTFGNIGIALTGMYFIFCLGTRPDDTWGYILPLIGVCLRQIVLTQQEEKAKSNNIKKQLQ
jgi:O-antigen ligase